MKPTDIYSQAIRRTFADVYGVSPDTVEVAWTPDGEIIIVHCGGLTFTHQILSDADDDAPEFFSDEEDFPVIVNLTDEERHQLERAL
jgi:hypothetical protein